MNFFSAKSIAIFFSKKSIAILLQYSKKVLQYCITEGLVSTQVYSKYLHKTVHVSPIQICKYLHNFFGSDITLIWAEPHQIQSSISNRSEIRPRSGHNDETDPFSLKFKVGDHFFTGYNSLLSSSFLLAVTNHMTYVYADFNSFDTGIFAIF